MVTSHNDTQCGFVFVFWLESSLGALFFARYQAYLLGNPAPESPYGGIDSLALNGMLGPPFSGYRTRRLGQCGQQYGVVHDRVQPPRYHHFYMFTYTHTSAIHLVFDDQ